MLRRHICLSRISDFVISQCNFFAYFKFHGDWGRVIGKIQQYELECRDTAPLKFFRVFSKYGLDPGKLEKLALLSLVKDLVITYCSVLKT